MKKITLLLSLCAFVLISQAQRSAVPADKVFEFPSQVSSAKTVVDTILPESFYTGTATAYTTNGGGFLAGTNEYGDISKAQLYKSETAGTVVEGMLVWIVENSLTSNDGDITFSLHGVDNGISTALTSIDVPVSQVTPTAATTGGFFYTALFDEGVMVTDSFAVSVGWKTGLTTGFGIVSTSDGDAGGTDNAWEEWGDETWNSIAVGWEIDIDLGIFPLVSYQALPVADAGADQTVLEGAVVTLDASASTNATSYKWMAPEGITLSDDTVESPTFTAPDVDADTEYEFILMVSNGDLESEKDTVIVTVQPGNGIDLSSIDNVEVYPNPFNERLVLENVSGVKSIILSNIIGQSVATFTEFENTLEISTTNLTSGIYFISIVDGNNKIRTEKLVKQ